MESLVARHLTAERRVAAWVADMDAAAALPATLPTARDAGTHERVSVHPPALEDHSTPLLAPLWTLGWYC